MPDLCSKVNRTTYNMDKYNTFFKECRSYLWPLTNMSNACGYITEKPIQFFMFILFTSNNNIVGINTGYITEKPIQFFMFILFTLNNYIVGINTGSTCPLKQT